MEAAKVFGGLEDNAPGGGLWQAQDGKDNEDSIWSAKDHADEHGALQEPLSAHDAVAETRPPGSQWPGSSEPSESNGSNGEKKKRKHRLTVKITQIELDKGDNPTVWFDIVTTLPRFRTTTFRDVRRTHSEIRRFMDHLASANPECFVPALPPATSSFPSSSPEKAERLRSNLQRWFDRITRSPLLARDEEFLYFVEASFGYTPVVKIRPPATGLARKVIKQLPPPQDEVQELRDLRPVAKLIYQYAHESSGRLAKVSRTRRALASGLRDLGGRLGQMVQVENKKGMINMWAKLGRVVHSAGDVEGVKATLADALYGDGVEQVSQDAYMIKETLTNRHILMRDLLKAQGASRGRHETATRLKGSSTISPTKVDEAITALEDATQLERRITSAVRRVTDNLLVEKPLALSRMEADLMGCMRQYALRFIDVERKSLSLWESIRRDVRSVDSSGGLSRLGREGAPKRYAGRSQSVVGDSWAGDRTVRAKDLLPRAKSKDEVVDAKSAVSLLAESVF